MAEAIWSSQWDEESVRSEVNGCWTVNLTGDLLSEFLCACSLKPHYNTLRSRSTHASDRRTLWPVHVKTISTFYWKLDTTLYSLLFNNTAIQYRNDTFSSFVLSVGVQYIWDWSLYGCNPWWPLTTSLLWSYCKAWENMVHVSTMQKKMPENAIKDGFILVHKKLLNIDHFLFVVCSTSLCKKKPTQFKHGNWKILHMHFLVSVNWSKWDRLRTRSLYMLWIKAWCRLRMH